MTKTSLRRRILAALAVLLFLPGLILFAPVTAHAEDSYAASVLLTFSDGGILSSDSSAAGYVIDGTRLTINAPGVYAVTGSCAEGNIVVKKGTAGVVLILKDLTLACSTTAPVACNKNTGVILFAAGDNTLTDLETDETLSDYEGAAIKVKGGGSLTLEGDGSLSVVGSYKNGIKGAAEATVTVNMNSSGSALSITAANNALACDGSVVINSGALSLTAGNEGIKADPDADDAASRGEITVNGGSIRIDTQSPAGGDGIQAAGDITIKAGSFEIDSHSDGIQAGGNLLIEGGSFAITAFGGYTMVEQLGDGSAKALKASAGDGTQTEATNELTIRNGSFILNTADDAVHSDANITVTGGSFEIRTGDDGFHADSTLTLGAENAATQRDPIIAVLSSYEGYEGANVTINSGKHYIVASDDGVNAAGGNDGSGGGGPHPGPGGPGGPGWPGPGGGGNYAITINGGWLYVNVEGDGLDSNGSLSLYGGHQEVWGQRTGYDNQPLDCDGTLTVKGATVFAAGGAGMGVARPGSGSQGYLNYRGSISKNQLVTVTGGGSTLYEAKTPKNIGYVFVSWPGISSYGVSSGSGSVSCAHGSAWTHSWDEGTVEGLKCTYHCTVCGAEEIRTLAEDTAPVVSKSASLPEAGPEEPAAPEAPVLSLDGMDTDGIRLSWAAVEGAERYALSQSGADEELLTEETSLLLPAWMGTEYSFTLRAGAGELWSEASNTLTLVYQPFTDVSGAKTLEYLAWAFNNGVVKGTSKTSFSPDEACSRVQFVMMLWKLNGSPEVEGANPFGDISGDKTTKAILWALDAGIINPGASFDPEGAITRVQIVMILWKLAGSPAVEGTLPFTDVSGSKTAKAVLWAYKNGITKGTSKTSFSPAEPCIRVQLVVFLYKFHALNRKEAPISVLDFE